MGREVIEPNPWMIAPFGLLLACIALAPVVNPRRWERHYPQVACVLAAITVSYYLLGLHAYARLLEGGREYVSFMVLIGSLFVVSGGIHISVKGQATPAANTLFLLLGALSANLLGTTGASMLLIRPWIRMNRRRVAAHHIVFFIFIVSNVGGCLTPVGDPPLFLGYLKGVPFWWVTAHCWPMWAIGVGFLLGLFYLLDNRDYRRSPEHAGGDAGAPGERWGIQGLWNIAWLLVILAAVFINHPPFLREAVMAAAAALSWFSTRKHIHEANHFNLHPLREVGILFIGIFATMLPALDWLHGHAGKLGNPSPGLFYWGSGLLSSGLDNAPTYLGFLSALQGLFGDSDQAQMTQFLGDPGFVQHLLAISIGAVFFGANTYIGNGPNFMVKAIAEHQKVPMPGFLGFIFRYSLPCMVPLLILLWLLFF